MYSKFLTIAALAASSLLVVAPVQAETVKVAPCNHLVDDAHFEPGLRVVIGGRSSYYPMGEQGLTRTIVYNEALAKAWVEELLGLSGDPIRYSDRCYPVIEDDPLPPEERDNPQETYEPEVVPDDEPVRDEPPGAAPV